MKQEAFSMAPDNPSLVVDGSSVSTFVGLLGTDDKWVSQVCQECAPLEGLFPSVEKTLNAVQFPISEIKNFIYCEGPGSVLGLRLCAMAIHTWGCLCEPTAHYFSYNSLELSAQLVVLDNPNMNQALLISDWKKDAWNSIVIRKGRSGCVVKMDDRAVNNWKDGPLFYLPQRKGWQEIPEKAITLEYSPQRLPEAMHLLKKTKKIELYTTNMNVFQKWIPQRHRLSDGS